MVSALKFHSFGKILVFGALSNDSHSLIFCKTVLESKSRSRNKNTSTILFLSEQNVGDAFLQSLALTILHPKKVRDPRMPSYGSQFSMLVKHAFSAIIELFHLISSNLSLLSASRSVLAQLNKQHSRKLTSDL